MSEDAEDGEQSMATPAVVSASLAAHPRSLKLDLASKLSQLRSAINLAP